MFLPEIWAKTRSKDIIRTTNATESYRRHLKDQFYFSRRPVHVVIDVFLIVKNESYLFTGSLASNSKLRTFREDTMSFL